MSAAAEPPIEDTATLGVACLRAVLNLMRDEGLRSCSLVVDRVVAQGFDRQEAIAAVRTIAERLIGPASPTG